MSEATDGAPDDVGVPQLGLLAGLDDAPTRDHVAVFESIHDALAAQLARTED